MGGSGPTFTRRSRMRAAGAKRWIAVRICSRRKLRSLTHALVAACTVRTPPCTRTGRAFFATRGGTARAHHVNARRAAMSSGSALG